MVVRAVAAVGVPAAQVREALAAALEAAPAGDPIMTRLRDCTRLGLLELSGVQTVATVGRRGGRWPSGPVAATVGAPAAQVREAFAAALEAERSRHRWSGRACRRGAGGDAPMNLGAWL